MTFKRIFVPRKKPAPQFVHRPAYMDQRDVFVTNLFELVYFPPIPIEKFTEKGIVQPCKALYTTAVSAVKNIAYQLYQVPAVRRYYGEEFVHGFTAKYDEVENALVYVNLDDTPETDQYTKEITAALHVIFGNFLNECDCYIFYQGDRIQFVTQAEMKKLHKTKIQNRIIWVE